MKKLFTIMAMVAMTGLMACSSAPKETENAATVAPAPSAEEIAAQEAQKEVQDVVSANMNDILGCYEFVLADNPGLAGKMVLSWTIEESGEVSDVAVKENGINNADLDDCLINTVMAWKFNERAASFAVDYPFEFADKDAQ